MQDLEPAAGHPLAEIGGAHADDIARSCARAAEAQSGWATQTHEARAQVLLDAAGLIRRHHEELSEWIMRECGGVAKADLELHDADQRLHQAAGMLYQPVGHMLPTAMPDRMSLGQRIPVGVVGVISPFNFPLVLSMRSVAPALALGNAVVLKPDERTPVTGGIRIGYCKRLDCPKASYTLSRASARRPARRWSRIRART